jgi:hypothetical protein
MKKNNASRIGPFGRAALVRCRVSAEKQNEYEGQQEREGHERGNIVCC